ncbi:DNA polymerase III subunit gamma and tau [Aeromicrobium sp. HA]|uniref:DNA polymerase III subunit gamma and tau n=1 Tax=Aeromicrobium sp. HA TaxID=3009077 RepID=UPI0022AEC469|nr:DNA polymerase III subunit gamma and tau [Aeromicrobium sp. HA]
MDAPLALYRRYRPETFAEVIGQDHVTQPLRHALSNNRVNHAYLFSGPRGCGKTTSARILARALNCERAPIADPCGECQSCRDLARGGPGSIDVIEIDAASHGGVDDARDLRERAFFAPVSSRYKVYIIDEAHMVSPQGFNALLKLVEEPPPHLKFIFATTEPDKVIGTIRSRTHHYPFRLVPPKLLSDYMLQLCRSEDVGLEPTALPLVVRAGGGSVRDSLSVLDQLLAGSGPDGITYDLAVQLLGYTPDSLLDEAVEAFAADDAATVFGVVDKVIESGQDPRRFAEDLLQRFRDLVILKAVPSAVENGLLETPADRTAVLQRQVAGFEPTELTRAADLVSEALTEFRGATAPRLMLELMCARILVPGADNSVEGFHARLDRLERRLSGAAPAPVPAAADAPAPPTAAAPASAAVPETTWETESPTPAQQAPEPQSPEPQAPEPRTPEPQTPTPQPAPEPAPQPAPVAPRVQPPSAPEPEISQPAPAAPGQLTTADVRRMWPQVLERVQQLRRFTWVMLSQNAQVAALDGSTLTLALVNTGARDSFVKSGSDQIVQQALSDVMAVQWRIEAIVDPSATPTGTAPAPAASAPSPPAPQESRVPESVRDALRQGPVPIERLDPDAGVDPDDPVVDDGTQDAEALLAEHLGAEIIDETTHG